MILIDGVRVNDPTTTRGSAYDLSSIDVAQLERVEVLRGPASAIYGADALAGVVNFITRKGAATGVGGSAYASIGQYEYQKVGGTVSAGNDMVQGHERGLQLRGQQRRRRPPAPEHLLGDGAVHPR